ncbi:uncharacterized protein LOC122650157 [Telopea speciosissima]|uniref:uncharacterized protein LOC122650157 n=1 Tax=Telopea speciosissima TaxID=54955 RepID=UPI001CC3FEA2|nr:uncharacterized protein LOC122650157 [Telopea speciosissima]
MASTVTTHFSWVFSTTSQNFPKSSQFSHQSLLHLNTTNFQLNRIPIHLSRFSVPKPRAAQTDQETTSSLLLQEKLQEVEESVKILKNAAKTRKVAAEEVLAALAVMEKAKLDPSEFLNTLGGSESPGRTWMLIFTAKDRLKSGTYFPITAVQRFDAVGKRIENGVFFGPLGCLTFEGRFSWKKRILAFIFECIRIKVGSFSPLQISLGQKDEREPSTKKDPFFIWFYIDEEIAVAQGRGGGTAFWCRCRRVT